MVVEILSSYLTQKAENLKDGTLRKLHTIALIGAFLLFSFMKVANAQAVVAVFVAEKIAGGSLSYVGKRGAESILGEDEQKNITPSQLSNIVGQIVDEQTKQLEATMRAIHRESNLFAYRKDLEDGLNSMESLLRNYNTRASTDTRMQRIRSILNYAATVEGAFQTFFRSETLNKHYPELFFTYYATYGRFAETFIVLKAEEQAVNNLMAAEGIKGYKEVDSYEVAKAASDKLALIHKFWYDGYPGLNFWTTKADAARKAGPECDPNSKYPSCPTVMTGTRGYRKPNSVCFSSNRLLNANGDPFKNMRLASSWGRGNPVQGLNKSLARDMDLKGQVRHFDVKASMSKNICNHDFPFYALNKVNNNGLDYKGPKFATLWNIQSIVKNEVRRDDWTGPIVGRGEYMLFNYYQASNTKGIITHPKFKAFIEPVAEVRLREKYPRIRNYWDPQDNWKFAFTYVDKRNVYTFSPKTSTKKVRECQIVSAFNLYNEYLKHLTDVDFNNKSFVGNLHELVARYNDGKNELLKNADNYYNLLTNKKFAKNCRNGK